MPDLTFYTSAEVAQLLRLHPQVVQRKLQAGAIPGYRIGREWRVEREQLIAWLEQHSNQRARSPEMRVVENFFTLDGRSFHELGLYFAIELPETVPTDGEFKVVEPNQTLWNRWIPVEELACLEDGLDEGARQAFYPTDDAHGTSWVAAERIAALATLADAAERADHYARKSKSQATINAYAAGWRDFLSFCERRGALAFPATDDTVAGYLAELADAGMKAATIARRLVQAGVELAGDEQVRHGVASPGRSI